MENEDVEEQNQAGDQQGNEINAPTQSYPP